jgi:acetate kinase
MNVLVLNAGSSSIKGAVLDAHTGTRAITLRAERLGTPDAHARIGDRALSLGEVDVAGALDVVLPALLEAVGTVGGVGHRVVHGGDRFTAPTLIDDGVLQAIVDLTPLAPLHNPANAAGIRAARALLPDVPHVSVFDTAFHATLPRRARSYALPADVVEKHGIRRYGFHGTSHGWCARQVADALEQDLRDLRIITCHLGNGASACAVEYGRSVETSMGMTPLEGLVMGTRSGDIDPGVLLLLLREEGLDADGLDALLNRRSGLAGLSGVSNDMRDIEARAAEGDEACRLALHVFTHRLRKQIGAYAAAMGGVDAIAFTGGIGENSALVRHRTLQRLDFLGARLDEDANRDARVSPAAPVARIDERNSRVALMTVACDEQREIARQTAAVVAERDRVANPRVIPIAVSARHIHLTRAAVDTLFGEGHQLTPYKPLSQPGQFACEEKLTIVGPKRRIEGVRVLGPERRACQVEVSRTDEFFLGLDAPVRDSGDVANSTGCTLIGPAGSLRLKEGVICARRHIHMTPDDAAHFGVKDRDVVEVAIQSEDRDLTFGDVLIRVSPKYALEMHLDTDEANAAEISRGHTGALVGTGAQAQLLRRKVRFDPAK